MTDHHASCRCGQLQATCKGDPVRVSVCHCRDCQKRAGSAFAAQVRFPAEDVTIEGESNSWVQTADSGNKLTFHFCPTCATIVHFVINGENDNQFDGLVAIPLGAFDEPKAFSPAFSVWEERKHDWVEISGDVEHYD